MNHPIEPSLEIDRLCEDVDKAIMRRIARPKGWRDPVQEIARRVINGLFLPSTSLQGTGPFRVPYKRHDGINHVSPFGRNEAVWLAVESMTMRIIMKEFVIRAEAEATSAPTDPAPPPRSRPGARPRGPRRPSRERAGRRSRPAAG